MDFKLTHEINVRKAYFISNITVFLCFYHESTSFFTKKSVHFFIYVLIKIDICHHAQALKQINLSYFLKKRIAIINNLINLNNKTL